ncbi:phosphoribosylanthranilate isomerase [Pontivivens ytuae]|uniref:N-(5'-phosphoribosyl)anthranilate isomerase n=1 Tax=Pontivivens ytuae TaxID=2789856 RepID=A0A7S9QDF5_9RHOB|nr:phosphoribosylanthranilate isomerase [Pontivivens ytuae]QPH55233.1 phosphoribosylanthranilate isomerase [Pontivivens ytuae]
MKVKICGLSTPDTIAAAVEGGAAYVGFVFFEKSSRLVSVDTARALAADVPPGVVKVGLFVNPDDAALEAVLDTVPLDMIQLHGAEPPERVVEVRGTHGLPVMKALGLRDESDLTALDTYAEVADQILVDAKPPAGGEVPGGNGLAFDWRLLSGRRWPLPWMLAGGLEADNVQRAANLTGATQVDLSSGVESAPGVKDPALIRAFLKAAGAERPGPPHDGPGLP